MQSKIIEVSMQTGWEWFIQLFAIFMILLMLVGIVAIGILIFKAIQALNIYIKKNK